MKTCGAYWNGILVGEVSLREVPARATIRCHLPDRWIYRAVLYSAGQECGRFGVLLPEKGVFTASAALEATESGWNALHCEVLRSAPGNRNEEGDWMTLDQCLPWSPAVFSLNARLSYFLQKKSGTLYRIYQHTNYILFPMDLEKSDPLAALYCVGNPVQMGKNWYLRLAIDEKGEIIPRKADET